MRVAKALEQIISGMTLTYNEYKSDNTIKGEVTKDVQFSFGDQKELNKWIAGRGSLSKYPLVWYVIVPYDEPRSKDYIEVNSRIYFFTSTKQELYNATRSLINYDQILEPLWQKVKLALKNANNIDVINDVIKVKAEPNFGVDTERQGVSGDFSSTTSKGTKSIATDFLDAQYVDLKLRIRENNCNN